MIEIKSGGTRCLFFALVAPDFLKSGVKLKEVGLLITLPFVPILKLWLIKIIKNNSGD